MDFCGRAKFVLHGIFLTPSSLTDKFFIERSLIFDRFPEARLKKCEQLVQSLEKWTKIKSAASVGYVYFHFTKNILTFKFLFSQKNLKRKFTEPDQSERTKRILPTTSITDHELESMIHDLKFQRDIPNGTEFMAKLESYLGKEAYTKLRSILTDPPKKIETPVNTCKHKITRASFHQADPDVFPRSSAGVQCCAMSLAFIILSSSVDTTKWNADHLNNILLAGNDIYEMVVQLSDIDDIPNSGFLNVRNFNVIKKNVEMLYKGLELDYKDDPEIYGTIVNDEDDENRSFGYSLENGLSTLFAHHQAGILIANDRSFAVVKNGSKFNFFNSHECDENGNPCESEGVACAIECDDIGMLAKFCKSATGTNNEPFTLDSVGIVYGNAAEE